MKVSELFEASTPMRAWNGKLTRIDKLMSWMYDKDILTKTEKAEKDKVFRAYYRYYNDGDLPGFAKALGLSNKKWDEAKLKVALENYLEVFIKKILGKYLPKVSRGDFRLDQFIKDISAVISSAEDGDVSGFITYWVKQVKISDDEVVLKQMISDLSERYDVLKNQVNEIDPSSKSYIMSKRIEDLGSKSTKEIRASWKYVKDTMSGIAVLLRNLQKAALDAKKQNLES